MPDFCKIFRSEEGEQIVVLLDATPECEPRVQVIFAHPSLVMPGGVARVFPDTEAGVILARKEYAEMTEADARAERKNIIVLLNAEAIQ